jgi:hypothetical protein
MPDKIINDPYEIYLVESEWEWYVGKSFGKTMSAERRFEHHMIGHKDSGAKLLWAAVQERGRESFSWQILESGVGDHKQAERLWYDLGQMFEARVCLNGGRPSFGGTRSEDRTPEWNQAIGDWWRGRKRVLSDEELERRKIQGERRRGIPLTEEHKRNISNGNKGKVRPEWDTLAKIERQKGKSPNCLEAALRPTECTECGKQSTAGGITLHQKSSGHTGRALL